MSSFSAASDRSRLLPVMAVRSPIFTITVWRSIIDLATLVVDDRLCSRVRSAKHSDTYFFEVSVNESPSINVFGWYSGALVDVYRTCVTLLRCNVSSRPGFRVTPSRTNVIAGSRSFSGAPRR